MQVFYMLRSDTHSAVQVTTPLLGAEVPCIPMYTPHARGEAAGKQLETLRNKMAWKHTIHWRPGDTAFILAYPITS
jgi:hypothetical protein